MVGNLDASKNHKWIQKAEDVKQFKHFIPSSLSGGMLLSIGN